MIVALLLSVVQSSAVVENVLQKIDSAESLNLLSTHKNVVADSDGLKLRGTNGEGSLVVLNEQLNKSEWSVEFKINNLKLQDVEHAGIYFFYTDKPVESGTFKGVKPNIIGLMAGIELMENSTEIYYTYNESKDETKQLILNRDRIPQHLLANSTDLILKIISTRNNFKIELRNENGLVADTLKISNDVEEELDETARHSLAISTIYTRCPSNISFILKNMQIMERKENEGYDAHRVEGELNNFERRKSDEEVRHTVADIIHISSYLEEIIGNKEPNELKKLFLGTNDVLKELSNKLDKEINIRKNGENETKKEKAIKIKIRKVKEGIEKHNSEIELIKTKLEVLRTSQRGKNIKVTQMLAFGAIAYVILAGLRHLSNRLLGPVMGDKKN